MKSTLTNLELRILKIAEEDRPSGINGYMFNGPSLKRLRRILFPENPENYFEDRNSMINGSDKKPRFIEHLNESLQDLKDKGLIVMGYDGLGIELTEYGRSVA